MNPYIQLIREKAKVTFPEKTLNKRRYAMPQIKSLPPFKEFLKSNNIKFDINKIGVQDVKFTQKEFNKEKIDTMSSKDNYKAIKNKLIIITKDNYIIDGHHRAIAIKNKEPNSKINVLQINELLDNVFDKIKTYKHVEYKSLKETLLLGR